MRPERLIFSALALLATAGVVMTTNAYAQTQGMERRGDRRDNRDEGREEKAACKAGDRTSATPSRKAAATTTRRRRLQPRPSRPASNRRDRGRSPAQPAGA